MRTLCGRLRVVKDRGINKRGITCRNVINLECLVFLYKRLLESDYTNSETTKLTLNLNFIVSSRVHKQLLIS